MEKEISKLPGLLALLKQSLQIYKDRFSTFFGISAILIIIYIFSVLGVAVAEIDSAWTGLVVSLFLLAAIFFLAIWMQGALFYAAKDKDENIGIKEAYLRAWRKITTFALVEVVASFIIIGGLFLLIVPGVIFMVWFSLATAIVAAEDLKGLEALSKSKEYVRGKWLQIALHLSFLFFIIVSAFFAVSLLFVYVLQNEIAINIASLIMQILILPFAIIYLFELYKNVKVEHSKTLEPHTTKTI